MDILINIFVLTGILFLVLITGACAGRYIGMDILKGKVKLFKRNWKNETVEKLWIYNYYQTNKKKLERLTLYTIRFYDHDECIVEDNKKGKTWLEWTEYARKIKSLNQPSITRYTIKEFEDEKF